MEEVIIQYELDPNNSTFWMNAANELVNRMYPDYSGNLRVNVNSDWVGSEAAWNNAISSGDLRVREFIDNGAGPAMGEWQNTSIAVPSYSDVLNKVTSWADNITLEKDTITFEAGSVTGSDDQIIASFIDDVIFRVMYL